MSTGRMFSEASYNSSFFTWLRTAKPWQLDYLLLASNAHDKGDYPHFVPKVLQQEFQCIVQKVNKASYSETAMAWFKENPRRRLKATPLFMPILIELIADGLNLPPAELANKCLENSRRFFQVADTPRKQEVQEGDRKVGWVWGWGWREFAMFCLLVVASFITYSVLHSVPYLQNFFTNSTDADLHRQSSV